MLSDLRHVEPTKASSAKAVHMGSLCGESDITAWQSVVHDEKERQVYSHRISGCRCVTRDWAL